MEAADIPDLKKLFKLGTTLYCFTVDGYDVPGLYSVEYVTDNRIFVYDINNDKYYHHSFDGLLKIDEEKIIAKMRKWKDI